MSIRISEGGRLFGIATGLGGAPMIGSAGRSWAKAVFVSSDNLRYDVRELKGADRLTRLVRGLLVIAGAAGQFRELDGGSALNIVNRNLTGEGVRLELSEPLRDMMFTENTRPRRKHTTTQVLWTFVAVCRDVIYWFEVDRSFCSR